MDPGIATCSLPAVNSLGSGVGTGPEPGLVVPGGQEGAIDCIRSTEPWPGLLSAVGTRVPR